MCRHCAKHLLFSDYIKAFKHYNRQFWQDCVVKTEPSNILGSIKNTNLLESTGK